MLAEVLAAGHGKTAGRGHKGSRLAQVRVLNLVLRVDKCPCNVVYQNVVLLIISKEYALISLTQLDSFDAGT